MFALVDCNNFYASCERAFNPVLEGKPIVVLSNNDGCVIARSNEAKSVGIPMGAAAFQFKELFIQHKISVFSSNYALYGDMSNRVMNILATFCPDLEIYSIDEAFLQFNGFELFDYKDYGVTISQTVKQWTSIPISIGFAPTKGLSKIANKIAKKFPKETNNVYVIDSDEKRIKALKWTKIEDVWGIGRQHAKRLQNEHVKTAYDFTQLPDDWVRKHLSVVGLRLKRELEGIPTLVLDEVKKKKAIATTRSFDKNYTQLSQLKERVSTFAVSCSEKLRKQQSCCNLVMVFVHTNGHRKDLPQYSRNIVIKTNFPTNSSIEIVKLATKGLEAIFKAGYSYKKAGVIVMGITPDNSTQLNLFVKEHPKHKQLMRVMDKLNNNIGQKKLKFACQDMGRTWKMNQEKLSPRYTTRLDEIITIKV